MPNAIPRSAAKPNARVIDKGGRSTFRVHTPERILPCKDAAQLQRLLAQYHRPIGVTPDNPRAHRWLIEKAYPCLRFWCQHFGVDVPEWLQGNGIYDDMSPEDQAEYIGPEPLDVLEFQTKQAPGTDSAQPPKPKAKG